MILRTWLITIAKAIWGIYLVLTSVYCLLAFLPYTYVAVIKAPPYEWMPWFANHQAILYWLALAPLAIAHWPKERSRGFFVMFGFLGLLGVYLALRSFLPGLQDNWAAYYWSLAALMPLLLVSGLEVRRQWPAETRNPDELLFPYSTGIVIAIAVALLYGLAAELHRYVENRSVSFTRAGLELAIWSLISHILFAIILLSVLNLLQIVSGRARSPKRVFPLLLGASIFGSLWRVLLGFLKGALTFEGWAAQLYASSLAAALTLWVASLVMQFSDEARSANRPESRGRKFAVFGLLLGLSLTAVALPTMIGGSDWNGVLQNTFTVIFWIVLSACIYRTRLRRTSYSWVNIVAVLILSFFAYKGLQATEIFWARPLGSTDDEVSRSMDSYAAQDASFQLVHHFLGNAREEACADLCRILRENTNIRDAEARADLHLVDELNPSTAARPNIFFFVIDSMRPDYLGVYNSQVDFTTQLDAFARDNIVVHNVYTQYAGTSLSEPAIWAGATLLHAHYMQPFARVNSLEKLVNADGYQMVVSYDEILRQLLSPADNVIKLDTDKKLWNQLEVCSTIGQLEPLLKNGLAEKQPVFFYAQPKNVHQFAHNDLPMVTADHWRMRPGFNNRIAHEVWQVDRCLGGFFSFLKSEGLYENSIIIVTSDHGDATGEYGRLSHSLSIYPEIMRVPLIVHLPDNLRRSVVYDDTHLSALTDITPSLYYLLGHRPIRANPLFGHALFVENRTELSERDELFLASDERAVYGLLMNNGGLLYTTYDSPAQSFLFDLARDPNALHSVLTDPLKRQYDDEIIKHLQSVADFYGYKPGMGSLLAAAH
jgi:hypothetical protein